MLTAVMMKVEGVTKEGEGKKMMMMMMMVVMMEGVTKEGGEGKKDQRVRIGLGVRAPH